MTSGAHVTGWAPGNAGSATELRVQGLYYKGPLGSPSSGGEIKIGQRERLSCLAGLTTTWEKGRELEWPLRIVPGWVKLANL